RGPAADRGRPERPRLRGADPAPALPAGGAGPGRAARAGPEHRGDRGAGHRPDGLGRQPVPAGGGAADRHYGGRPAGRADGVLMAILRTDESRFTGLAGFDLPPRYAEVPSGDGGTLRVGYVEAGPAGGPVVLLLHGEPTWSYLYRTMIPVLA